MAYKTNNFCWHGLNTTDPEKAAAFYSKVAGWKSFSAKMGDADVTMFTVGDVPFAHYQKPPMEGVPSHWNNYLRVDDVDASVKAAEANGGKVLVPPTDIPPGRFSIVTSPSGAAISLFHEADEATATHHPGGSVHWTELHSTDLEKDLVWLKETLGFSTSEMPMPEGQKYYILSHGDEQCGGAMSSMAEGAPSMWVSWMEVDDADAALARVTDAGGQAFSPLMDMEGVGRMAMVADPTGAPFGIITPTKRN